MLAMGTELGTVLLWSFNFTAIRYAVSHGFAPLSYAAVRWAIAALAFSAATWRLDRKFEPRMDEATRAQKWSGWQEAVRRTLTRR